MDLRAFDLEKTLKMDPEFLNVDGEHEHDDSVSSLSIVADGDVDFESFQNWIGDILREKAADIYRMKKKFRLLFLFDNIKTIFFLAKILIL